MTTLPLLPNLTDESSAPNSRAEIVPLHESGMYRYNRQLHRFLKRLLDIVLSLVAIAILAPLGILVALFIRITSRGPVLFRQERIGYRGKRFTMLKFRTMIPGNDPSHHHQFVRNAILGIKASDGSKIKNDPRVTPVGRILRRTSLDEIPQFINVLKGDMSLVGPRPCLPYEFECYENWHRDRVRALPGLTGIWQISDREQISFNQMVHLDLAYLHHWSIWLDLSILLKTPAAVLSGKGAR